MMTSSVGIFSTMVTAKERTSLGKQDETGSGKELNWPERQAKTPAARKKGCAVPRDGARARLPGWSSPGLGVLPKSDTRVVEPKPALRG